MMKPRTLTPLNINASSIKLILASMDPKVASVAKRIVVKLFYSVKQYNLMWLEPRITTKGNDSVTLEWWENGKFFALSVNSNGFVEFVKAKGSRNPRKKWESNTLKELEIGQQPSEERLIIVWRWLTK